MENKHEEEVVLIDLKKIHEHPLNPRSNLGSSDLNDLAESIKAQGVLQPLTVVPAADKGEGEYYVVMGHRRRAAASKAKLKQVPCVIRAMTEQEIIHAMLGENIVRRGLNPKEEAFGFQTALNLGLSEEEVAAQSGFSTRTIQKRCKLTRLDESEFKRAAEKGVPLGTFEKIAELEDPELREKALQAAGTSEFDYTFERAKRDDKAKKFAAAALPVLSSFAKEVEDKGDLINVRWLSAEDAAKFTPPADAADPTLPEDAELPEGKVRYFFVKRKGYDDFNLYRERTAEDDAKDADAAEKQAENKQKEDEVNALNDLLASLRGKFIGKVTETSCVQHLSDVMKMLYARSESYASLQKRDLNPKLKRFVKKGFEEAKALAETSPAKALFLLVCAEYERHPNNNYYGDGYVVRKYNCNLQDYEVVRDDCDKLDALYDLLEKFGYEKSKAEQQVIDGTHPIYAKPREKTEPEVKEAEVAQTVPEAYDDGDGNEPHFLPSFLDGVKALFNDAEVWEILGLYDGDDVNDVLKETIGVRSVTFGEGESITVDGNTVIITGKETLDFTWDQFLGEVYDAVDWGCFEDEITDALQTA